jgi:DNA-binding transcriptional ArsR family regulator
MAYGTHWERGTTDALKRGSAGAGRHDGLNALADPTRRAIFERIAERPRTPGELAQGLPVTRPAVSQHLKVLKDAGLVTDRAVGTRRIYQLNPDGLAALRAYLEGFWNRALEAFKEAAEKPTKEVS